MVADYGKMIRDHVAARAKVAQRQRERLQMSEAEAEYDPGLQELFECNQVATTKEVADALGVAVSWAREWAKDNVDRVGNAFVWTLPVAQQFADEVEAELDDEDEETEGEGEEEEEEPDEPEES